MAQWFIFALLILGVVIVVFVIFSRAHGRSKITTPYLRAKSRLVDEKYGISFVWGIERTGEDSYTYQLRTDQEGMVNEDYGEDDIIDLNKHLNVASDQIYITRKLIAKLSGLVDLVKLEDALHRLKNDYEQLQAQHNLLRANQAATIQEEVSRITEILKSVPRGGKSR